MPPAYTPSADTYHGETTVESGPRRPFQQRPRPSHSTHRPSQSHSSSGSHSHSSHTTSSSSQSQPLSPSQQRPQQPVWTVPSSWPAHTSQQYQSSRGGGLVGALLSTVRDAVSGLHDEQIRPMQQSQARAYAAPYPTSSSGMTQSAYTPSYQGGRGPVPGVPPAQQTPRRNVPDDGSPTRTPTPGHPLLNNGQVLVYPNKDFTCIKCKNTGYKNYDPSHPCKKCWEKYGKPYAGALMYTSWNTESSHNSKFQRALPRSAPPQASQLSSQPSNYTGRPPHVPPQAPYGQHLYVYNPIIGMGRTPPVPHAIPVCPGDPRLGGQMCQKCGGTGTLPLLIIDVRPCSVCGGIGRNLR